EARGEASPERRDEARSAVELGPRRLARAPILPLPVERAALAPQAQALDLMPVTEGTTSLAVAGPAVEAPTPSANAAAPAVSVAALATPIESRRSERTLDAARFRSDRSAPRTAPASRPLAFALPDRRSDVLPTRRSLDLDAAPTATVRAEVQAPRALESATASASTAVDGPPLELAPLASSASPRARSSSAGPTRRPASSAADLSDARAGRDALEAPSRRAWSAPVRQSAVALGARTAPAGVAPRLESGSLPAAAAASPSERAAPSTALVALAPSAMPAGRRGRAPERWRLEPELAGRAAPTPALLALADRTAPVGTPGPLEREPSLDWSRTPYQARRGAAKLEALERFGGSAETEAAVRDGLEYLASVQRGDGYWGSSNDRHEKYRQVVIGKTGLCLLAFLGAGHVHTEEGPHSGTVSDAIRFLLAVQDPVTGHLGDCSAYGHLIGTYALAEAFALTRDERLRAPLELAVERILAAQESRDDPRFRGGWSYFYPDGSRFDRWPRVSITAWAVMALRSARLGGLDVPDAAFADARGFLDRAWDTERGAYRYSHDPVRLRSRYDVLPGSTPAALFALSLLGEDVAGPRFEAAREFVLERAPREYRRASDDRFVSRAAGNLYFWYYGSLACFRSSAGDWERWNGRLKETLIPAQEADGSWEPISTYAEYAGDDRRDRSYSTALCVLSLEVYYRYFTPLLATEAR
ncbi:MAG: hypothetical protein AAFZ65_00135, partial [Planctomycetota bacterium]